MHNIGIPLDILEKMPVRDRRAYIAIHNKQIDEENKHYDNNSSNSNEISGEMINKFTDLDQQNIINREKR